MINFQDIYNWFKLGSSLIVLFIILSHLISKVFKKNPLELNRNSLIVIVGACMGIGKEISLEICRVYKCRLIVIDRRKDLFEEVSQQLTELGGKCEFLYCDLSNKKSLNQSINYLLEKNQMIDMFIYNAGIAINRKTWDVTDDQHDMVMMVNYFAPTIMIRKLEKLFKHVCVVASMAAIISGGCSVSTYSASKHAIFSYLSSVRQQYKKYNKDITISIGCPYLVTTTLFQGFKTKLDFLFRHLTPEYTGKRLLKEFIQRKQVCFMYQYQSILFKIIEMLPSNVIDICAIKLDQSQFVQPNTAMKSSIISDKSKSQ